MPASVRTFHSVGGEEGQVLSLERVDVGGLTRARLRIRLPRQAAVVHLEGGREGGREEGKLRIYRPQISWQWQW